MFGFQALFVLLVMASIPTVIATDDLESRDDIAFTSYKAPGCAHSDAVYFKTGEVGKGCFNWYGGENIFHYVIFNKPGQIFSGGGCRTGVSPKAPTGKCIGIPGGGPITGVKMD